MRRQAKELRYFLFSQQLADGVRITAAVLLPAAVLYQFNQIALGMTISMGALAASLTDAPGPVVHRRNGMLAATGIACIVALITSFVKVNVYALGAEIALFTFLFSLFQVYGPRPASVGNVGILVMILTMGRVQSSHPALYVLLILAGGIWYVSISLFFYYIRPYRPAQRVLGDCIREVASYLSVKALFYDVHTGLQDNYIKLVAQQVVVNEKQDAVREFFFKTARIVSEESAGGRRLVSAFVHTVDLFEDITAVYYNYSILRTRFESTGILEHISKLILQLAGELDSIGVAVQSNSRPPALLSFDAALAALKNETDILKKKEPEENTLLLKKILVNVRRIAQRIQDIRPYFDIGNVPAKTNVDHTQFTEHQTIDPKLFWNNLTLSSTAFRYSLRVAIACVVGFAVSKVLAYGQHSYWIVLTIAFILKPAFSLTKMRNIERIWGTVAGGVAGFLILYLVKNTTAHFILMVLLMAGAFTFQRTRYVVMVICTTAYILILFQFLNLPFISVVQERIFDTVLGGVIAFAAGYFLFPDWEAQQLHKHMAGVVQANAVYLQKVAESLEGAPPDKIGYKLARKAVYVQSANLSAAFQRMAAEPKNRQQDKKATHRFIVRNHLLFSNVANAASLLNEQPRQPAPALALRCTNAIARLHGVLKKLDGEGTGTEMPSGIRAEAVTPTASVVPDDFLLQNNIEFIVRLCNDIEKTTDAILAA